jgi:hypothetical protein
MSLRCLSQIIKVTLDNKEIKLIGYYEVNEEIDFRKPINNLSED